MRHVGAAQRRNPCFLSQLALLVLALFLSPAYPVPSSIDLISTQSPSSEQTSSSSPALVRVSIVSIFLIVLFRFIAHRLDILSDRFPDNLSILYAQIAFLIAAYYISAPIGLAISVHGIVSASLESGLAGISVLAATYFANYSSWSSCSRLCQLWYRIPDPAWLSETGRDNLASTIRALIRLAMDDDSSTHLPFHERVELAMLLLKFSGPIVSGTSADNDRSVEVDVAQSPCTLRSSALWKDAFEGVEGRWLLNWAQQPQSPIQSPVLRLSPDADLFPERESPTSIFGSPHTYGNRFLLPASVGDTHEQSPCHACDQDSQPEVTAADGHRMEQRLSADDNLRYVVAVQDWIRPIRHGDSDRSNSLQFYKWVMKIDEMEV
ncbi:hypothetical protein FGB62_88g016 [Gracilaria domingensis]|nr:hypothetical protein FGB62_88g016 [Gracilaria domingensis]